MSKDELLDELIDLMWALYVGPAVLFLVIPV